MKLDEIKTPISSLVGVGAETARLFSKLNIFTVSDLLQFYPRAYKDRTKRVYLNMFELNSEVNTIAQVVGHEWFGYGKMRTLKIQIRDKTAPASLICFNRAFLEKAFPVGSIIAVSGNFHIKYNSLQSTAFDAEKIAAQGSLDEYENSPPPNAAVFPVYPLTQGLSQKKIRKAMQSALSQYLSGIDNELGDDIIALRSLLPKKEAIKKMHEPQSLEEAEAARRSLAYEELFILQKTVLLRAYEHKGELPLLDITQIDAPAPDNADETPDQQTEFSPKQAALLERLPFGLTRDQMKVILQMNRDIDRGYRERSKFFKMQDSPAAPENLKTPFTMQRLLQGDVGSGKTLTALFACLRVIEWGGQCAFMAPTEILAKQHAESTANLLQGLGIRAAFLSGNTSDKGRTRVLKALKSGEIDIILGTHALFSKTTIYNDLQLAVIDEQHRFGVMQRQAIIEKGRQLLFTETTAPTTPNGEERPAAPTAPTVAHYAAPHLLMMSATPIPQTLALTVYGDLDVSVIKTMPAGRKPIKTYSVVEGNEMNAYNAVRAELAKGRQAYFVYPAIEDNPELSDEGGAIKSAEAAFKNLSAIFPEYKCALLHSKIAEEEQSAILNDFRQNKIQILAATTVVEVGVDVPNATCMAIEQADRFGLSQLHQLRGRVGRGAEQSYCFLIYRKNITDTGKKRINLLRQSNDGFFIAEEDLKLRGPGEITGTAQAGELKFAVADLSRDNDLMMLARRDAFTAIRSG